MCVFIRYAQGGLKYFKEAAALMPSNMPRRVGWGLALTAQNEIVLQNEIQSKTVQNKDRDRKTQKSPK